MEWYDTKFLTSSVVEELYVVLVPSVYGKAIIYLRIPYISL